MTYNRSAHMKAKWADPDWRAMMLPKNRESIKKANAASAKSPNHHVPRQAGRPLTAAQIEARRRTMTTLNQRPELVQRIAEGRKQRWKYKVPADPKWRLLREALGVEEARRSFGV